MFNHTMDRLQYIKQIIYIISTLSLKSSLYKQKKFIFLERVYPAFIESNISLVQNLMCWGFQLYNCLAQNEDVMSIQIYLTPQTETY
jgi:hypothetical protein